MLAGMRRESKLVIIGAAVFVALYVLLAYILLPSTWQHYEHQKKLATLAMVTRTHDGIPGDPINVGLVGSKADVLCAMKAASWYPADPITLRSSIEIAGSVLLDMRYRGAPVSHLFYEGRRQDLAFEKPVGRSADRRHHVRFWQALDSGQEDRPVWLGAVTFDRGIGFSHDNGQITHHIAPDVDAERDVLAADLDAAKVVESTYEVSGIGPTLHGRNGEGDRYFSDGEIKFSVLVEGCGQTAATETAFSGPPLVEAKNRVWSRVANVVRSWIGAMQWICGAVTQTYRCSRLVVVIRHAPIGQRHVGRKVMRADDLPHREIGDRRIDVRQDPATRHEVYPGMQNLKMLSAKALAKVPQALKRQGWMTMPAPSSGVVVHDVHRHED